MITGSNGLLGQKLVEQFSRIDKYNLILTSIEEKSVFDEKRLMYAQVDTTNRQRLRSIIDEFEPDVIVHTAAFTDVDRCETERELAWRTNVGSVENLVYAAKLVGARLIHISSDYVFDGKKGPYSELDRPNPISYYGKTKLASENVLRMSEIPFTIIRTMVLYGVAQNVKLNFALWVVKELSEGHTIRVVDDQWGNPTLADDLAFAILKVIEMGRTGCYHIAGPDLVNRYEFAVAIAKEFNFNTKRIQPIQTSQLKQPAPRPLRSGFITLKAETDLNLKMSGIQQGIRIFKNQCKIQFPQFFNSNKTKVIEIESSTNA